MAVKISTNLKHGSFSCSTVFMVLMIMSCMLLYKCNASISLAINVPPPQQQTESNTMTSTATSTTPAATTTETNKNEIISSMLSNDVLSQTDSSSRSSIITIQKLRQLFPGLWSFRPGKTAATTTMQDTNGFSFQLTERTGQRETYSGLLQIHAHTDPQWLIIDISNKDITYQFKATKGYSRLRVDVRKDKFCFSLKFMPKDSALLERVSEFSTLLLEGKQSIYSFTQTSAKYDSAINTLCTSANNVSRIDGFLIGDESFVSCAKKPAGQQNFSPHIFITRNLIIKVGLQMGKGKFITASKRCILLDKFDTKLADALGNRYFAEILSDSMDNKRSIERGSIRPTFWFETKSEACVIPYMADAAKCASYLSSSTAKPTKTCIFVHGAGGSSDQAPRSTFSDYWGDIENWTPQCKKRVFAVRDTLNVGWDDAKLQKYYCDLAVKESGYNVTVRGVPYLKNVVIFSHSQGGLVISAALNNRKCALDSTSSWYSVSTPFEGSEVVDKMVNYCASFKSGANVLSKDYVYGYLATKFGYCDPATGKPYPGYFSISKNYSKNGVTTTQLYTSNTSRSYRPAGRMCGTSPIGIISKYSILLTVLSGSTDLSNPNDGMLENSSCTSVCTQTFNSLYTSNFYTANINHADTSCRNGNGWYSRSKQPCLYYKDKV